MEDKAVEEVLEFIWTQREKGTGSIKELLGIPEIVDAGATMETLKEMERVGFVKIGPDSADLTQKWEKAAEEMVRRHRLAERLLCDLLDIERDTVERHACSFEHSLSPAVTDSICTLWGIPRPARTDTPYQRANAARKKPGNL